MKYLPFNKKIRAKHRAAWKKSRWANCDNWDVCKYYSKRCEEWLALEKNDSNENPLYIREMMSLCWCCANASPLKCGWMKDLTPVKGWVAEWDEKQGNNYKSASSWKVKECPNFKVG